MFRPNWYQCADGSWKPYDYGMDDGPRRWHSEDAEMSENQSKVESEASMDVSDKPVRVEWNILEGWRTSARMYVNQLDGFLDGMRMEDVKVPRCIVETRQFMASLMEDIASVQNRHETLRTMGEEDDVGEMLGPRPMPETTYWGTDDVRSPRRPLESRSQERFRMDGGRAQRLCGRGRTSRSALRDRSAEVLHRPHRLPVRP